MARTRVEISKDIEETKWCIQNCERSLHWDKNSATPYIHPGDVVRKQEELDKHKRRLQELMREEQEAN